MPMSSLEDTKAALDAGQALVALNDVFSAEVQDIGQHDELAVVAFSISNRPPIAGNGSRRRDHSPCGPLGLGGILPIEHTCLPRLHPADGDQHVGRLLNERKVASSISSNEGGHAQKIANTQ